MAGVLKIWNGSAWTELEVSAPVGPQGPTGPTGPVAGSINQVVYKDGSNNPTGSANLTFDGTRLSAAALTVDTSTLFVDATNDRVGIGTTGPSSQLHVAAGASTTIGAIVQGAASQSANLQEWRNSAGTSYAKINSNMEFVINGGSSDARGILLEGQSSGYYPLIMRRSSDGAYLQVARDGYGYGFNLYNVANVGLQIKNTGSQTAHVPLVLQGVASQSANLQEWQNSSGTVLASMSASGGFSAATKSFDIPHPTDKKMRLQYGSVEAPEHSVQIRGRSKDKMINLPKYWAGLVDSNTITIQLTSIGSFQELFVKDFNSSIVEINGPEEVDFFYLISAERIDVPKLVVEYER